MDKIYYRYFNEGDGKNQFELREYIWKGKDNFETKGEARKHFKSAEKEANKKFSLIKKELKKLKETLEFNIGSFATANDDLGLDLHPYIGFKVNGYSFEYSLDY